MRRSTPSRISYEPYLFGIAIIGMIYKFITFMQEGQFHLDWMIGATVLIFTVSSALWLFNTRPKKSDSSIDVSLETGKIQGGTIVGAEAGARDHVRAEVKTGDATNAKITGYRET